MSMHNHKPTDKRPVPVLCVRSRLMPNEHPSVQMVATSVVPARQDIGAALNQVNLHPFTQQRACDNRAEHLSACADSFMLRG